MPEGRRRRRNGLIKSAGLGRSTQGGVARAIFQQGLCCRASVAPVLATCHCRGVMVPHRVRPASYFLHPRVRQPDLQGHATNAAGCSCFAPPRRVGRQASSSTSLTPAQNAPCSPITECHSHVPTHARTLLVSGSPRHVRAQALIATGAGAPTSASSSSTARTAAAAAGLMSRRRPGHSFAVD